MKKLLVLCLFISFEVFAGEINPLVTQDNLLETVCNTDIDGTGTNWVSTQRPSSYYTQQWEKQAGGNTLTIVDHIIPICAGGDSRSYANYQLQLKPDSYRKDVAERLACKLLCEGKITLKQAQQFFWQ